MNVIEIASTTPNFSILVDLVIAADLGDTLAGSGPFTLFAPTNEAFQALSTDLLESLASDIDALTEVLLYHVVPGEILSTDLVDGASVATILGSNVSVSLDPVMINTARVVTADIDAANGVIHVIDSVLIPPAMMEDTAGEDVEEEAGESDVSSDLVETASETPGLSILVDLVAQAGLVETLKGDGPFTVFAPTNNAFRALPTGTLSMLARDIDALTEVLLYHVVADEILSQDLVDGALVTTVLGSDVSVSLNPPMINDADIYTADILATNGVIHVIDSVLIPPSMTEDEEDKQLMESVCVSGKPTS